MLSKQRAALRYELYQTRVFSGDVHPRCPVCHQFIWNKAHLHEALLTRRDIQGLSDDVKLRFHVKENCTLIHERCHESTQPVALACAAHLKYWVGTDRLLEWLESVQDLLPRDLVDETVALLAH